MSNELESDKDRLAMQLATQQHQLQLVTEALQSIINTLQQRYDTNPSLYLQDLNQQLNSCNDQLGNLNFSLQELQQNSQEKLSGLPQILEKLLKQQKLIQHELNDQKQVLKSYLSWKFLVVQFGLIGLITGMVAVLGLRLFPPPVRPELRQSTDSQHVRIFLSVPMPLNLGFKDRQEFNR